MVQPKRTLADLGISRETLELTPGRSMQLLSAIATVAAIRAPLQKRGYTNAVHQRGWDLLEAVIRPLGNLPPSDTEVNDAIATLDAWDQEGLELVRVSLTQFPEVRSFLLEGLEPAEGLAAVLVVKELLARFETALSMERGAAAMARLAEATLDATEIARLSALVKTAQSVSLVPDAAPDSDKLDALIALRDWYDEWAGMCRLVIKRRDYLIRLGLAERRSPRTKEEDKPNKPGAVVNTDDGEEDPPFLPDPDDR